VTDDAASFEADIRIAAEHPALAGHFPGNPVVPGVVLLERVLEAAEAATGRELRATGIPQVKFLAPLLPGETGRIRAALTGESLGFTIARGETPIARGTFTIAPDGGGT
jgi:3-hydroxymyristoyl/3-hydroxydecanoyl-(acyl carrier protein) dehydratase